MSDSREMLEILCEDGPVIAVNKPPGLISQGAPGGMDSLVARVKDYLKQKYDKPGNVYLGVPHRLDRPVSGAMVFARNSKCAARLAEQFAQRQVGKTYWACLERPPENESGTLTDWIDRVPGEPRVEIVSRHHPGAKVAVLDYRTLGVRKGRALVEIVLRTGRMHQIRIQFGSRGCPVLGDRRYGGTTGFSGRTSNDRDSAAIALHARRLTLLHPIRYDELSIVAPAPPLWRRLPFDLHGERS